VNEAPYILDGLLMNPTDKRIREQYADTGGFTDLVFAATSLLGYLFIPRIRDLPSKRLHVFDRRSVPTELRGLVSDKIRENTIIANWPDVLRCIATVLSGRMQPSQLLKKLAARPRRHDLAVALREIGRVERTLFIIEWLLDTDMQRRAQIGLNKGEAHHALKSALRIGRQGEIRDRTTEGQHFSDRRAEPAHRHHNLLEYKVTWHRGRAARKGRIGHPSLSSRAYPTPWMGAYHPHG
jgi:TnpA family transposase